MCRPWVTSVGFCSHASQGSWKNIDGFPRCQVELIGQQGLGKITPWIPFGRAWSWVFAAKGFRKNSTHCQVKHAEPGPAWINYWKIHITKPPTFAGKSPAINIYQLHNRLNRNKWQSCMHLSRRLNTSRRRWWTTPLPNFQRKHGPRDVEFASI